MFNKILIANRGEIAVRIMRACQEMGVTTVAVYSEADAQAMHVRLADESVLVGPAPADQSYLMMEHIIEAALQTGSEAIHPGYGFLSESPDFAQAVSEAGLIFIGPPADAIRKMGVKTEARAIMQAAGVPVVPGYQVDDASDEDYLREAEQIGYPVMVKAAGGGGGKGIRIVHEAGELVEALGAARREAQHAFGDGRIFLEKYIDEGRHIEFQVIADLHGNTLHLFERECSIQRRHQKIIEETPSPLLTPDLRERMGQAAVDAAKAVGYVNVGTVEFIADSFGNFYFLEMNTRLQVEHPITEVVTGVDLVRLQLQIALGETLPFAQDDLSQRGHAIECRVYAEDPANDFLPSTGPLLRVIEPSGPGIRVDSGVATGGEVTFHYDPMLSKVIVYAPDRASAIQRMRHALSQYVVMGVQTNIAFLNAALGHDVFQRGEATTHFVESYFGDWRPEMPELPDVVLMAAAIAGQQTQLGQVQGGVDATSDPYSPWNSKDGFRMGPAS